MPAYYNAGSAALVLILILLAIGTFIRCRIRRRSLRLPSSRNNEEESIPLTTSISRHDEPVEDEDEPLRSRKGKERAHEALGPPIFDVGDDDDEEGYKSDTRG